jgi:hypothetical protein
MKKLNVLAGLTLTLLIGICAALVYAQSDLLTADYTSAGWKIKKQDQTAQIGNAAAKIAVDYHFGSDGGKIGNIDLGADLDPGWIIVGGVIDVIEQVSPRVGTTNMLWILTAGDIMAATTGNVSFKNGSLVQPVPTYATRTSWIDIGTNKNATLKYHRTGNVITSGHFRVMLDVWKSH